MILVIFRVSQLFRKKRFRNQSVSSVVVYIYMYSHKPMWISKPNARNIRRGKIMVDVYNNYDGYFLYANNVYRKYYSIIRDNSWSITVIMNFSVNNLQWEKKSHMAKIKQQTLGNNSSEKHRVE